MSSLGLSGDGVIDIEELRLDPVTVQAYLDGASAQLTRTEFRVLYVLALQRGRVFRRGELLERIWGQHGIGRERAVDHFVRRLRAKIDHRAPRHTFLHTWPGVGYQLEPQRKWRGRLAHVQDL